jgi:hypothetical protein
MRLPIRILRWKALCFLFATQLAYVPAAADDLSSNRISEIAYMLRSREEVERKRSRRGQI